LERGRIHPVGAQPTEELCQRLRRPRRKVLLSLYEKRLVIRLLELTGCMRRQKYVGAGRKYGPPRLQQLGTGQLARVVGDRPTGQSDPPAGLAGQCILQRPAELCLRNEDDFLGSRV
jgi:hypothetical protein